MKKIIGLLLILFGIGLVIYVGLYLLFIGGIIQVIEGFKNDMNGLQIAIGVVKVISASFVGGISGLIPITLGQRLIKE